MSYKIILAIVVITGFTHNISCSFSSDDQSSHSTTSSSSQRKLSLRSRSNSDEQAISYAVEQFKKTHHTNSASELHNVKKQHNWNVSVIKDDKNFPWRINTRSRDEYDDRVNDPSAH